jgi:hypothetical protein
VVSTGVTITAALTVMTGGLGALAGVLIFVAVGSAIRRSLVYHPVRSIEYEEVLDLAIREAKLWNSRQMSCACEEVLDLPIGEARRRKSPQMSSPMEHELKCQGFNLVKPYPFQSDVV